MPDKTRPNRIELKKISKSFIVSTECGMTQYCHQDRSRHMVINKYHFLISQSEHTFLTLQYTNRENRQHISLSFTCIKNTTIPYINIILSY